MLPCTDFTIDSTGMGGIYLHPPMVTGNVLNTLAVRIETFIHKFRDMAQKIIITINTDNVLI